MLSEVSEVVLVTAASTSCLTVHIRSSIGACIQLGAAREHVGSSGKGVAVGGLTDFGAVFGRLASGQQREEVVELGGVNIRMVRVAGGGEGRWDHHALSAETVVVWSGDFTVEFRDRALTLTAGQCCVVPAGAEHRGTSRDGAEVILFQQAS